MGHLTSDEKTNLFDATGPLATFGGKILIAYGAKAIDKAQERHLSIIKKIRNVFAHTLKHVTFETAEVSRRMFAFVRRSSYNEPTRCHF